MNLSNLISKLKYCDNPESLLQFEEQFNTIGLTVQMANSGKIFLCLIKDNEPANSKLFEDYIPICHRTDILDDNTKSKIVSFLLENISVPSSVKKKQPLGNYGLYGDSIQQRRKIVESELIGAIAEWIDV